MTQDEVVTALGRTVLFNGLDPDVLKRLAGIARVSRLASGSVLFNQGDGSDGLYVVASGIVRIYLRHRTGARRPSISPRTAR